MNRREFLKKAGLGSAAAASFPALSQAMVTPAWADEGGRTNFRFVSFTDGPTIETVKHRMAMSGNGHFTSGGVEGAGTFTHFNELAPVPKTILGQGTWKATKFISFTQPAVTPNTYGGIVSGILVIEIRVVPDVGFGPRFSATLTVICNIGFAGISTGLPEGFTLDTPSVDFATPVAVPTATPGVSVPLGLTVFTSPNETRGNVGG